MTELSESAKLMLLIFAAHGGTMSKSHAVAEFNRVVNMTVDEYAQWLRTAKALAAIYAQKHLEKGSDV